MPKHFLILLVTVSCLATEACFLTQKSHVYIHNDLPSTKPVLEFHCSSKDDNLGFIYLDVGKEYTFSFCPIPYLTSFYCQFWWNGNERHFNVYNANVFNDECARKRCYYSVRDDGFYLSYIYPPRANDLKRVKKWTTN